MADELDLVKERDSFFSWMVIHAITSLMENDREKYEKIIKEHVRGEPWRVTMQIDGVEVSARSVLEQMRKNFSDEVRREAQVIVRLQLHDILGDTEYEVFDLLRRLKDLLEFRVNDLWAKRDPVAVERWDSSSD